MTNDIDLGKISITPKGVWSEIIQVEYNDIWKYLDGKYLALKDSFGITPSDDGVYWYELSTQGMSAYEIAVNEGYEGTIADWLAYLKQPALDAAAVAEASVQSINIIYKEELDKAKQQLVETVNDAVQDKVVRPLTISSKETKIGVYKLSGEDIDVYEKSTILEDLPKTVGESKQYIVAEEPLGYGLYFNVESFVASSGKSLAGSFFNSNYQITSFTINESLHSVVTVTCIESVSVAVRGVLRLQYCKFYGDVVEFDLKLPLGINKDSISLSFPKLKFNKKLIFSYITDDSNSIYQYIFAAINKRKVVTQADWLSYCFHLGMDDSPLEGFVNQTPLQCTDGCGNMRRYATTVAVWAPKLKDQYIGMNVGKFWPWMSEKEFKMFVDFGFMVGFHDIEGYTSSTNTQDKFDACVDTTAALFQEYIGMTPKLMVEPNGDHAYLTYGRGNGTIQFSTAQSGPTINKVYPFKSDFTLDKHSVAIQRQFAYGSDLSSTILRPQYATDLINTLKGFNTETDLSKIYWLIGSAHRCGQWEAYMFKDIYDLYGAEALDNLWFPTLDEFYEYWFMSNNTTAIKTNTDDGIHYKLYIPKMPNFFYRDLSIMLDGITSKTDIELTTSDNVYGSSFGINDNKLLVNLNFDEKLLARAEKYVSIFEANYNERHVYDDAQYFVQQLKPGLREGYEARLNVLVSPPTLATFVTNNGDTETRNRIVNVTMSYTGQAPTEYIISENEDFSGAVWSPYVASTTFEISEGFNKKTLYAKLKNIYGMSAVKATQISYAKPDLVFQGLSVNNGDAQVATRNIQVKFNYIGYPEKFRLSEIAAMADVPWLPFTASTVDYQISTGFGVKTVYGQLDDGKIISQIYSDSIELIDATSAVLNSVVINDGIGFTASGIVSVLLNTLNTITKYRIGTEADLSALPWQQFSTATVQYTSAVQEGQLILYAQVANDGSESETKSSSITIVRPVVLSSITLDTGGSEFSGFTLPVSLTISQGIATHYRLAETTIKLEAAEWAQVSGNIQYTFAEIGSKTLYAQVKNQVSESSVVSSSILINEPPVAAVFCLYGGNDISNNIIDYPVSNGITINRVRFIEYLGYKQKQFKSKQGSLLPWFLELDRATYYQPNDMMTLTASGFGNLSQFNSILTGDAGVYPDVYIKWANCTGPSKGRVVLTLPIGKYKFKMLMSVAAGAGLTESGVSARSGCFYSVHVSNVEKAKTVVGSEGFTGVNNVSFNAEMTFEVLSGDVSNGNVTLYAWNSSTENYRPALNLLEIEKL